MKSSTPTAPGKRVKDFAASDQLEVSRDESKAFHSQGLRERDRSDDPLRRQQQMKCIRAMKACVPKDDP